MGTSDRCETCNKVTHETLSKAKTIARRTRSNNLNDKRIFNAYQCDEPGCASYVVGTNDQFSAMVSRKFGKRRKKSGKNKPPGGDAPPSD